MNRLPGNPGAVDHVLPADDRRAPEHLVDPGDLGGGASDEAGAGVGDGLGAPICDVHRILGSFDPLLPSSFDPLLPSSSAKSIQSGAAG